MIILDTFEEILKVAVERDVDMILLGGDLFVLIITYLWLTVSMIISHRVMFCSNQWTCLKNIAWVWQFFIAYMNIGDRNCTANGSMQITL